MRTNKQLVHFRFDAELNELLEAASGYLGTTKTALVEKCIRKNLDEVVAAEEKRKKAAAKFHTVRCSSDNARASEGVDVLRIVHLSVSASSV